MKAAPGTYLRLARTWRDNDAIELRMPFSFYLNTVVDQPNVASVFHGPVLLAAEELGRKPDRGVFTPWKPSDADRMPQNERNQQQALAKRQPPPDAVVPGLYDFFIFDATEPTKAMKDFSVITGPAAMPPLGRLGTCSHTARSRTTHRCLASPRRSGGSRSRWTR